MKVKIIYRNYKPLHQIYYSLKLQPPKGVIFIIPEVKNWLKKLYNFYHRFGHIKIISSSVKVLQQFVFKDLSKNKFDDIDLLHYAQIIPKEIPNKPFVVDFSTIVALSGYQRINQEEKKELLKILSHNNCKKILTTTKKAKERLKYYFEDISGIENKVETVYPALENYSIKYSNAIDYSIIDREDKSLKLLFVGNDIYHKGLHELLPSVKNLLSKKLDLKLYIISDCPKEIVKKYQSDNILFFPSNYSKEELIKKFFLPSDLFVLPSHGELFGMVFLDALSSSTPILTIKTYATPEIVIENHNGLFINSEKKLHDTVKIPDNVNVANFRKEFDFEEIEDKIVTQLEEKITLVYEDRNLLNNLKKNCSTVFDTENKFSIKNKNNKLLKIYEEAIK